MSEQIIDELNRSAKLFMDNGAASTAEEAIEKLRGFRMHLIVGEVASKNPTQQAAFLTALNCGRRTFLGGVSVSGALDAPLLSRVAVGPLLADAVRELRGIVVAEIPESVPIVSIGESDPVTPSRFAIRTTFDGWRAGVVPSGSSGLDESIEFAPSGVLAGALAVSEVFAHVNGEPMAGHRAIGLSLWDQAASADWRSAASDGPRPDALPADFWLIGLGHLGQAFIWTIGLLNFADPSHVRMYLQDDDVVGRSTESTSILTGANDDKRSKARVCSQWAERCGFVTRLVERRFDRDLRVRHGEPLLALCGVDNPDARRILEGAGFATVFEAGLGAGVEDFRLIRTHSFPGPVSAEATWLRDDEEPVATFDAGRPPSYEDLRTRGALDECGLTQLAEVAVGAPFVGAAASAVLVAQIVRLVVDGKRATVCNLDLRAFQHRGVVYREKTDIVLFATAAASGEGQMAPRDRSSEVFRRSRFEAPVAPAQSSEE
jgi:hypothetical protein